MIRKLRLKFVCVCMLLVTSVLAAVFAAVYITTERGVQDLSRQVLHRVVQESSRGSFLLPEFDDRHSSREVILPYFTVEIWGSRAYVTGGTYDGLEDTEALESILAAALSHQETEGMLAEYGLRYLRQEHGLYTTLAFVDTAMETSMVRSMMQPYALIGGGALAVLLGIIVVLSFWITRPVAQAWHQQRQFLSDASHELKTPLTVILSNAELLLETPMDPRPARWADNIHSEAGRMKQLVEEMLTLARADSLAPTAPHAPLCLSDVAADCALAFEPVAFEAGKPLHYDIAEKLTVLGDGEALRRLVGILLDNAIKYGAEGAPISLTLEKCDRQARLTVSNTGTPIAPEVLPHLFERFYRADSSRGEQSGFGLGLSIAQSIAQEHRAALRAESDQRSTRLICTIPLKK